MADLKKQLKDFKTVENRIDGNEYVFVSQNGNTRKTTINDIKKFTIGTEDMGTSATTIKGAIKEHEEGINNIASQLNANVQSIADLNANKLDASKLTDINSSIDSKRDKQSLIGIGDLTQEVKTAMTGGNTAVVGNECVGKVNLANDLLLQMGSFITEENLEEKNIFYDSYHSESSYSEDFKTIIVGCSEGEIYNCDMTIQTSSCAIVWYLDTNKKAIQSVGLGESIGEHKEYKFIIPNGVTSFAICSFNSSPVLRKYIPYNLKDIENNKLAIDLNSNDIRDLNLLTTFEKIDCHYLKGYYDKWHTTFTANGEFNTIKYKVNEGEIYNCDNKICDSSVSIVSFLDNNDNMISGLGEGSIGENKEYRFKIPSGVSYIAIVGHTSKTGEKPILRKFANDINIAKENIIKSYNQWYEKKIIWLGTSVSFGQYATKSYAQEAANRLKFNLINTSVPGLAIETNLDGSQKTYGSSTLSKAEYNSQGKIIIPSAPITYVPGGSYNDYYRTYENIFCEANKDADLYVFDVVPNNTNFATTDWDKFDYNNWNYKDGSTFESHRSTFLGALLFLMDKMYALNENARMCFVLGSSFSYEGGKEALKTVSSKWNIPIIDLWGKMNISPKSLPKLKSQNGTNNHPSTLAHEMMGEILSNELLLIR